MRAVPDYVQEPERMNDGNRKGRSGRGREERRKKNEIKKKMRMRE